MGIVQHMFPASNRAIEVIKRQIRFLKRLFIITTFVVFLAYYIYLIVTNKEHPVYLTIYSVLLALHVVAFIADITFTFPKYGTREELDNRRKKFRNFKLVLKMIKWTAKLVTLGVILTELLTVGASEVQIMMYVMSIFVFIADITFTIIIRIVEADIDLMKASFREDVSKLNPFTPKEDGFIAEVKNTFEEKKEKIKNFFRGE